MGAKQVVMLYLSISHTDMSQWVAKMYRQSRAQTALMARHNLQQFLKTI